MINTSLLLEVADIAEAIPPSKFDISSWHSEISDTYCVIGYLAKFHRYHPQFSRLELIPSIVDDNDNIGLVVRDQDGFIIHRGWGAVKHLFGLTTDQAEFLFWRHQYPNEGRNTTPADVAQRIRQFAVDQQIDRARELEVI